MFPLAVSDTVKSMPFLHRTPEREHQMKRLLIATACALCVTAQASVVTSIPGATAMPVPSQFVNAWGGTQTFVNAWQGAQTFAPGVLWTSNISYAFAGGADYYGFGYNGIWSGVTMIGLNDDAAGSIMTLSFAAPVSGIAGLFNYAPGIGSASISAYDSTHALIETKVLDFSTDRSQVNQGAYLGFLESSANISYFTMSGGYIGGTDFSISGNPAPVPEPATCAMLLAGCGLVGAIARRKRMAA